MLVNRFFFDSPANQKKAEEIFSRAFIFGVIFVFYVLNIFSCLRAAHNFRHTPSSSTTVFVYFVMHDFHKVIDVVVASARLEKWHVSLLREVDKYCRDSFEAHKLIFDRKTASAPFTTYCYGHPNGFCGRASDSLNSRSLSDSRIFTHVVQTGNVHILKRMLEDGVVVPRYVFVDGKRLHACSLALLSSCSPLTKMALLMKYIYLHKEDCFEIFYFMVMQHIGNANSVSYELTLSNLQLFMQACTKINGTLQFSQDDVYVLAKTLFTATNVSFELKKQICCWFDGPWMRTLLCLYNQHDLIAEMDLDNFSEKEILYAFASGNLKLYQDTRNRHDISVTSVPVVTNILICAIENGCGWKVLESFLNSWSSYWKWDLSSFCCREVFEILIATAAFAGSLDILTHLPYAVTTTVETWDFSNLFYAVKGNQATLFTYIIEKELDVVNVIFEPHSDLFVPTMEQTKMCQKILKSITHFRSLVYNWQEEGYFVNNGARPEQTILTEPITLCFILAVYFRMEKIIDVYCENERCKTVVRELIQRCPTVLRYILVYVTDTDLLDKIAKTFSLNATSNASVFNGQTFVEKFVSCFDGPAYIEALKALNHDLLQRISLRKEIVDSKLFIQSLMKGCEFLKGLYQKFNACRYTTLQQQNVFPASCVYNFDWNGKVEFTQYPFTPEICLHKSIICLRAVEATNPYFMKTRSWQTFLSALPDIVQ